MTCDATTPIATHGQPAAGPFTAERGLCGRALPTSNGPKPASKLDWLNNRADRLRFPNGVQRQRYLQLHQILDRGA